VKVFKCLKMLIAKTKEMRRLRIIWGEDTYFECKGKAKGANQWKITTNALFVRLDSFQERCQDIMHFTSTIIQFNKLQKIEIGNTKGKQLTASVMQIFEEFNKAVDEFMQVTYDIMDIEKRQFDDDFYKFRNRIKELERRLASILTQSSMILTPSSASSSFSTPSRAFSTAQ
jgi:dynein heavy chain, axonemal